MVPPVALLVTIAHMAEGKESRDGIEAAFARIISDYAGRGKDLAADSRLAEAVLLDCFPHNPAEVRALVSAIKVGTVQSLLERRETPADYLITGPAAQLAAATGLRDDMAKWATETWWNALGALARETAEPPPGAADRPAGFALLDQASQPQRTASAAEVTDPSIEVAALRPPAPDRPSGVGAIESERWSSPGGSGGADGPITVSSQEQAAEVEAHDTAFHRFRRSHLIAAASVVVLALAIFAGVGLPGHHPSFKKTDVTSTTTTGQSGLSSGSGHRHRTRSGTSARSSTPGGTGATGGSQQRRSTSTTRPTSRRPSSTNSSLAQTASTTSTTSSPAPGSTSPSTSTSTTTSTTSTTTTSTTTTSTTTTSTTTTTSVP